MSATEKHTPDDDNELFDLLVDNELDQQRRSRLLSGLDKRPDGWRKCALAFLQAQSFQTEFSLLLSEPAPAEKPETSKSEGSKPTDSNETPPEKIHTQNVQTPRRPWSRKNAATLSAMAASFLLAMGIGIAIENRGGSPVVGQRPTPSGPTIGIPTELVNNSPGVIPSKPMKTEMVDFSSPHFGGRGIRVPAVERDELDEHWLQNVPPAMPDDVLGALKRTGHRVEQSRELVPMKMKDGRRLVVPVDQVDVHYVGDSAL